MILNPFRVNKALKQAERYVTDVKHINDELTAAGHEQNEIIRHQNRIIDEQRAVIQTYIQKFEKPEQE